MTTPRSLVVLRVGLVLLVVGLVTAATLAKQAMPTVPRTPQTTTTAAPVADRTRVGAHRVERRATRVASRIGLGVLVLGLVTGAALATQASPAAQGQLRAATTRLPERFTELYFTTNPPGVAQRGAAGLSVGFAVANREDRTVTYPYVVTGTAPAGQPVVLRAGVVRVPAGGVGRQRVTVPRSIAGGVVSVRLLGRAEHLHARVAP